MCSTADRSVGSPDSSGHHGPVYVTFRKMEYGGRFYGIVLYVVSRFLGRPVAKHETIRVLYQSPHL